MFLRTYLCEMFRHAYLQLDPSWKSFSAIKVFLPKKAKKREKYNSDSIFRYKPVSSLNYPSIIICLDVGLYVVVLTSWEMISHSVIFC